MPSCIFTLKKSCEFSYFDWALLPSDSWSSCVNAMRLNYGFNRDAGGFFGRRTLSLNSIALAAFVILASRPENVSSAGFQMSFAATIALFTVFQPTTALLWFSRWRQLPVISLVLSSLAAGLATAPFSSAHFNQVSHFGLLANIQSLLFMGFLVAPSSVLAVMLMPFGAEAVGLWG